jgi:hypothetical protein
MDGPNLFCMQATAATRHGTQAAAASGDIVDAVASAAVPCLLLVLLHQLVHMGGNRSSKRSNGSHAPSGSNLLRLSMATCTMATCTMLLDMIWHVHPTPIRRPSQMTVASSESVKARPLVRGLMPRHRASYLSDVLVLC